MHDAALVPGVTHRRDSLIETRALELVVPPVDVVRGGEMGEDAVAGYAAVEIYLAPEVQNIGVMHADAVHPRLNRHMVFAHTSELHGALAIRHRKFGRVQRWHDLVLEQRVDCSEGRFVQHENRNREIPTGAARLPRPP